MQGTIGRLSLPEIRGGARNPSVSRFVDLVDFHLLKLVAALPVLAASTG